MSEEMKRYGFFTQSHEDDVGFMAETPSGDFMFVSQHQRNMMELNEIIAMQSKMLTEAMLVFEGKEVVSHELKTAIEMDIAGHYAAAKQTMDSRGKS